jgi:hypothetical protein
MLRITLRRSQKLRRCPACRRTIIHPGDQYLEHVISPDHDDVGNCGWWRAVECRACAVEAERWPILNGGIDQR